LHGRLRFGLSAREAQVHRLAIVNKYSGRVYRLDVMRHGKGWRLTGSCLPVVVPDARAVIHIARNCTGPGLPLYMEWQEEDAIPVSFGDAAAIEDARQYRQLLPAGYQVNRDRFEDRKNRRMN